MGPKNNNNWQTAGGGIEVDKERDGEILIGCAGSCAQLSLEGQERIILGHSHHHHNITGQQISSNGGGERDRVSITAAAVPQCPSVLLFLILENSNNSRSWQSKMVTMNNSLSLVHQLMFFSFCFVYAISASVNDENAASTTETPFQNAGGWTKKETFSTDGARWNGSSEESNSYNKAEELVIEQMDTEGQREKVDTELGEQMANWTKTFGRDQPAIEEDGGNTSTSSNWTETLVGRHIGNSHQKTTDKEEEQDLSNKSLTTVREEDDDEDREEVEDEEELKARQRAQMSAFLAQMAALMRKKAQDRVSLVVRDQTDPKKGSHKTIVVPAAASMDDDLLEEEDRRRIPQDDTKRMLPHRQKRQQEQLPTKMKKRNTPKASTEQMQIGHMRNGTGGVAWNVDFSPKVYRPQTKNNGTGVPRVRRQEPPIAMEENEMKPETGKEKEEDNTKLVKEEMGTTAESVMTSSKQNQQQETQIDEKMAATTTEINPHLPAASAPSSSSKEIEEDGLDDSHLPNGKKGLKKAELLDSRGEGGAKADNGSKSSSSSSSSEEEHGQDHHDHHHPRPIIIVPLKVDRKWPSIGEHWKGKQQQQKQDGKEMAAGHDSEEMPQGQLAKAKEKEDHYIDRHHDDHLLMAIRHFAVHFGSSLLAFLAVAAIVWLLVKRGGGAKQRQKKMQSDEQQSGEEKYCKKCSTTDTAECA